MASPAAERHHDPLNGALAMQGAVIAFTLQDAGIKWLLETYAVAEVLALRSAIVIACMGLVLGLRGKLLRAVRPDRMVQVYGRGALIVCAFFAYFTALIYMPLPDVVAIFFAAPLIQSLLSWPVLGEAVGWRRLSAIFAGFVGVLIMVGPAGAIYGWPALAAVASAVFYAGAMVWSRALGPRATPVQLTFATNVAFLVAGGVALPVVWTTPAPVDAGFLALMAGLNFLGHIGLAAAYRLAPVAVVSPLDYTAMPLAVLLGVAVWGDWPTWGTVAGVPLVIASGAFILWREQRLKRLGPDASPRVTWGRARSG
ncbi:Permease of the drug/metabolite transporter (DMT) superfamily [Limimonas halophila]|uniref:Permease of the drug/metabolite transporter (DMT) superfamily n=1 Tax=Limimonas halophila TaxID=1082479 RepID=A0A1G7Q3J2_9PROT|nr:DMT family transporter [Limimonas halophila]SDF93157.1 Permease of the drug/metabolite transporter (DMT) superfamily [Limimonas halophila]